MNSTIEGPRTGPVVLPKGNTGVRTWRRERMKRQRRQRRLAAVGLFAVVVVATVLVGLQEPAGNRASSNSTNMANPVAAVGPLPSLFVVTDNHNAVQAIYLLAPLPSGKGGNVLVIPANTLTPVVPGGPQAVGTALISTPAAPGDEKMVATVENMLGIAIGSVAIADYDQFSAMAAPAGSFQVDLPVAIGPPQGTAGGSFPAGPNIIQPNQIADFMTDQSGAGSTEQLTRFGLLLQSWINKLRSVPAAAPSAANAGSTTTSGAPGTSVVTTTSGAPGTSVVTTTSGAPGTSVVTTTSGAPGTSVVTTTSGAPGTAGLGRSLIQLSRGVPAVQLLPVDEIPAESPGAPVEYQVNQEQLLAMLPGLVPGQPAALEPRPRVQLLNGTGGLGLDEEAMVKLEPWVDVSLSGNACSPQGSSAQISCFGYGKTEIITYDSIGRSAASRIARLLGTGRILRSTRQSDTVDMTVIVGADFHVNG